MDIAKIASERLIEIARLTKECDEALAKLAAVEGQNPCAWMNDHCETTIYDKQVDYWKSCGYKISPLYAKPVPADKQHRCAECGPVDAGTALYCVKCWYDANKPAVAVPEFLLEMSKQMREQPNRSTANPFWQVRCKRTLPTEAGYNEIGYEIVGDDGVVYRSYSSGDELESLLLEDYPEFCQEWCEELDNGDSVEDAIASFDPTSDDLPEGLRLVYVQEVEEVISTHLTEADAKWFIGRKQHDYPKLYTYVESAYWAPQFKQLQDWIISLSAPSHSQQSAPKLLTWLPSLLDHYEKQARLNGFTPDTSLKMVRAAIADLCPSHKSEHKWDENNNCTVCGVNQLSRRTACPSHESEELQTLRAHGLAENQQTEGE